MGVIKLLSMHFRCSAKIYHLYCSLQSCRLYNYYLLGMLWRDSGLTFSLPESVNGYVYRTKCSTNF